MHCAATSGAYGSCLPSSSNCEAFSARSLVRSSERSRAPLPWSTAELSSSAMLQHPDQHPAASQCVGELDLSVVVAAGEGLDSIGSCLEHLRTACAGLAYELLVVTRAGTATAAAARDILPE